MIPLTALVLVGAFFRAQEHDNEAVSFTRLDVLKTLLVESLHLGWQLSVLALIFTGLHQIEVVKVHTVYFEKALGMVGAYLLSQIRGKTSVYFIVLAALALGLSDILVTDWKETFG